MDFDANGNSLPPEVVEVVRFITHLVLYCSIQVLKKKRKKKKKFGFDFNFPFFF